MKPANYAPVYAAALYPQWAEIARAHGYALAVHGSLARDFDLIAIPWRDDPLPSDPQTVVDAITAQFAAKEVGGPPSQKPHGRRTWTLSIGFGECFADLSFMPRFVGMAKVEVILQRDADCPACAGSGEREMQDTTRGPDGDTHTVACPDCNGTGTACAQRIAGPDASLEQAMGAVAEMHAASVKPCCGFPVGGPCPDCPNAAA